MGLSLNYDIALIFLEEPVLDVDHAFLPSAEEGARIAVGDEAIVVGWGQQIATGQLNLHQQEAMQSNSKEHHL